MNELINETKVDELKMMPLEMALFVLRCRNQGRLER